MRTDPKKPLTKNKELILAKIFVLNLKLIPSAALIQRSRKEKFAVNSAISTGTFNTLKCIFLNNFL